MKEVAGEFLYGLPEKTIDKIIEDYYEDAKRLSPLEEDKNGTNQKDDDGLGDDIDNVTALGYFDVPILNLYESEMRKIASLDSKLRTLAFAFLVVNKFYGYRYSYECNADLYRLSHNEKKSGKTRNVMLHRLVENGVVKFYTKINKAYRFNQSWIAKTSFIVPINVDFFKDKSNEKVWMQITNYDDIMLYLGLYLGDERVSTCTECGCPIEVTNNAKKYCSNCSNKKLKKARGKAKKKHFSGKLKERKKGKIEL